MELFLLHRKQTPTGVPYLVGDGNSLHVWSYFPSEWCLILNILFLKTALATGTGVMILLKVLYLKLHHCPAYKTPYNMQQKRVRLSAFTQRKIDHFCSAILRAIPQPFSLGVAPEHSRNLISYNPGTSLIVYEVFTKSRRWRSTDFLQLVNPFQNRRLTELAQSQGGWSLTCSVENWHSTTGCCCSKSSQQGQPLSSGLGLAPLYLSGLRKLSMKHWISKSHYSWTERKQ